MRQDIESLVAALKERRPSRYERYIKPSIDLLVAIALLILLSPIIAISGIVLLLTIGRPVLLRQTRAGRDGRPFEMLKFRTMLPDRRVGASLAYVGPERRRTHKTANDPRHTRVGRLMRKISVDELPQLVNVLRGDMSLVGPRPELYELTEAYLPWQHSRHLVKPGVTGVWQTTARGEGQRMHECVDLDLLYINGLSFGRDMAILGRTPIALLRTRGVV